MNQGLMTLPILIPTSSLNFYDLLISEFYCLEDILSLILNRVLGQLLGVQTGKTEERTVF